MYTVDALCSLMPPGWLVHDGARILVNAQGFISKCVIVIKCNLCDIILDDNRVISCVEGWFRCWLTTVYYSVGS